MKEDFNNKASSEKKEHKPKIATPKVEQHHTPGGPVEQAVHTQIDNAARKTHISPQLRDEKIEEFKKQMRLKKEFNRAARGQGHSQGI